jgi:hypothetical protein
MVFHPLPPARGILCLRSGRFTAQTILRPGEHVFLNQRHYFFFIFRNRNTGILAEVVQKNHGIKNLTARKTMPTQKTFSQLMDAHFLLAGNPDDGPINVRWSTQLVSRNKERAKTFYGVPAFVIGLVGTILIGNGWYTTDVMVPHTEVSLTTKFTIGQDSVEKTIKRYSDIFYINDEDCNNYYQMAASDNVFSRSIAGKDEAWRMRLAQQGWLSK